MWDLWKEVFCKYRDEWIERRLKLHWTQNLWLIVALIAVAVILVFLFQVFIYPGRPTLF